MDLEIQSGVANSGMSVSAQPATASIANDAAMVGGSAVTSAVEVRTLGDGTPVANALHLSGAEPGIGQTQGAPELDASKLKALPITLGHDVEAEWDHLIALAKKAL